MNRIIRFVTAVLFASATLSCAHTAGPRQPANAQAENPAVATAVHDSMSQMFREMTPTFAFLMSDPDQNGVRQPVCYAPIEPADSAEHGILAPPFLKLPSVKHRIKTKLPKCDEAKLAQIKQVAELSSRPEFARMGGGAKLLVSCGLGFGVGALAAAAYIYKNPKKSKDGPPTLVVGAGLGMLGAGYSAAGGGRPYLTPSLMTGAFLGCAMAGTVAGTVVGYSLVTEDSLATP